MHASVIFFKKNCIFVFIFILLWYDNWSGTGRVAVSYVDIHDVNVKLRDIIMFNGWNLEVLYTVLPHDVASQLQRMKPQLVPNHQDLWVWESSDSGCYTVKDGYTWLANRLQQGFTLEDWRWLLRLKIPERIRIFIWLVVHNSIQTNLYRFRCNMVASPSCTRCSAPEEDAIHCLRDCPHSRELWMRASALSWPGFLQNGCDAWVRSQVQGRNGSRFLACLWGIWKWRNNMIF